jgi:hypothetical protein
MSCCFLQQRHSLFTESCRYLLLVQSNRHASRRANLQANVGVRVLRLEFVLDSFHLLGVHVRVMRVQKLDHLLGYPQSVALVMKVMKRYQQALNHLLRYPQSVALVTKCYQQALKTPLRYPQSVAPRTHALPAGRQHVVTGFVSHINVTHDLQSYCDACD